MSTAMISRLPVTGWPISQGWKQYATAGVVGVKDGTTVQQLVYKYGNYQPHGHDGIDIGCPMRTPVYAPGAGVIDWAGWSHEAPRWVTDKYGFLYQDDTGGIMVLIDHGNGLLSAILHLDETDRNAGERTKPGELVGLSGTSGRSGGPHVHFSLIELALVYVTAMYGRINPLSRIPAGTTVPFGPGGTGDAAGPAENTIAGIPGLTVGVGMATPAENQAAFEELCRDANAAREDAAAHAVNGAFKAGNHGVEQKGTGRAAVTQFDGPREGWGLFTPIPWYGFDGKQPASGRSTTTLATDIGWNDTRWAQNAAAHKAQSEQLSALQKQVADLTALVSRLLPAETEGDQP